MSENVIYKIRNKVNGKIYIGSTQNKTRRLVQHKSNLRNNRHDNPYLQNAWNKYSTDNFEFTIVEKVEDIEDLIDREQFYIDKLEPEYNIKPEAGRSKVSKETKQKLREANLGEKSPRYGKKLSEKHKQRISEANIGKELSDQHKKNISKALAGKERSDQYKKKRSKALQGEKSSSAKLTKKKVKIIKHLLDGGSFTQKQIGKMFGVVKTTINAISTGEHWSHVKITS